MNEAAAAERWSCEISGYWPGVCNDEVANKFIEALSRIPHDKHNVKMAYNVVGEKGFLINIMKKQGRYMFFQINKIKTSNSEFTGFHIRQTCFFDKKL